MSPTKIEVGHDSSFAVRWQSFRAFQDTAWVALKPLTLLLGPNSSGKTSFIVPLLVLKQSLASRTGSNALLTKGDYADVGVYEDFVRNHDKSTEVTLSLRWHSHGRVDGLAPVGSYSPGGLTVAFDEGSDPHSVILRSYRVEDPYGRSMLTRNRNGDGSYTTRMIAPPDALSRPVDVTAKVKERRAMRKAIRDASPTDFLFLSRSVRRAGRQARIAVDEPSFPTTIDDDRSRLYCAITDHVEWGIESILDRLRYIGPLREEPRRVYELSGEMPDEVGTRGEFAPEIVYRWRKNRKRMREVQKWLRHFGFSEQLDFRTVGTGGFSLTVTREGSTVASTFVDTGFGMSQVLPLVVQGLVANPGQWLVIEQPEIHLNPKLQAALADLFADVLKRGVNLIVESHSEHLLMRLRRLVAQQKIDDESVGLYFVEQANGRSSVNEVPIDEGGFIQHGRWPQGFFEDSLRESMALAQAQMIFRRGRARQAKGHERQLRLVDTSDAQKN